MLCQGHARCRACARLILPTTAAVLCINRKSALPISPPCQGACCSLLPTRVSHLSSTCLPFPASAAKEIERLQKQQAKLEKELAGLNGRLSNPKFVDKAPEKVVAEARQQAAEMGEQLAQIADKIAKFGSLA